ncbi:hypothetical protein Gohar_027748 [Gossypium harknessii]|uniref:Mitochondrial import inner membrane translocase subunit TIM50 n=1 Tax=Gossypium harknessii TaxID=34285 RepID=A0A7J9HVN0_9ROSI|nr:hypothetical protein [Gossypium harknessii]
MAELTPAEVYTPRSMQVWRALLNWLAFFFQIFAQIIRAVGQYPLLSSSSTTETKTTTSSSTHRFKPLPVVDSVEIECPSTVEIAAVLDSPVPVDEDRIEKLTVVLDLDETLVCAYETSSLPPALRSQATDAGLKWFELECVSSDKEFEGKPKISYVTVFERPGLQEFLNQLSEFAELVLFTAGLEGLRTIKHCFVFIHFHPFICFPDPPQAMLDRLLTELMRKIDLVIDFIGLLQFVRKYHVLHMLFL